MRAISFIILALFFLACTEQEQLSSEVVFKGGLSFETGQLKSFDPDSWTHYFNPDKVTVTLSRDGNDNIELVANSSKVFFEEGTSSWYVPHGIYTAHVEGGGWGDRIDSYSHYNWTIKDTVIKIDATTGVITFNLDKTPGLIIRDQDSGVEVYYQSIKLKWSSRYDTLNVCDFIYVVPAKYTGKFGESEYDVELAADHYVYFKAGKQSAMVNLPAMSGDTINY